MVPKRWISTPSWCSSGWLDRLPPLERLRASNGSPDLRGCCFCAIARLLGCVLGPCRPGPRFAGNHGAETARPPGCRYGIGMTSTTSRKRVLVLGGGFGGMYTARRLERRLPPDEAEIVLINPENYMLYTPLLPEAAAGTIEPRHVVVPLRQALRRTRVRVGNVTAVDLDHNTCTYMTAGGSERQMGWDRLVVALGSVSRMFPVPGLAEHAVGFKTLAEAIHLRNHVLEQLELADATEDPDERTARLGFVVVGASSSCSPSCRRWCAAPCGSTRRCATVTPAGCWRTWRRGCCRSWAGASRTAPSRCCAAVVSRSVWRRPWSRSARTGCGSPAASGCRRRPSSGPPGSCPIRWPASWAWPATSAAASWSTSTWRWPAATTSSRSATWRPCRSPAPSRGRPRPPRSTPCARRGSAPTTWRPPSGTGSAAASRSRASRAGQPVGAQRRRAGLGGRRGLPAGRRRAGHARRHPEPLSPPERRDRPGSGGPATGSQAREGGEHMPATNPQAVKSTPSSRSRPRRTAGSVDERGSSKEELMDLAKKLGVRGRSRMNKGELAGAIASRQRQADRMKR